MSTRTEISSRAAGRKTRAAKALGANKVVVVDASGSASRADRNLAEKTWVKVVVPHKGGMALDSDYVEIFRASPIDRVRLVKAGVSAVQAKYLLSGFGIPSGALHEALQLSVSTLNRKAKSAEPLPTDESERLVGLARLVGQVEVMVSESGDADGFDARSWTARWLTEPVPALGGMRPMELMDTMEGQAMVSDVLSRVQSGAYA